MDDKKLKNIEMHANKRLPKDGEPPSLPVHRLAIDCLALIKELKKKKSKK